MATEDQDEALQRLKKKPRSNKAGRPEEPYVGWSFDQRQKAALTEVIEDERPVATMAKKYGLSPNAFREKVKLERATREERLAQARDVLSSTARVANEKRRVPPFEEFVETYWGSWICPDCGVHHPMPDFHKEIIDAVEGPDLRVGILLAPYHSKSSLVTIWHTVYDTVRDPNRRTIIVSKASPLAKAFTSAIVQLLRDPDIYGNSRRNLIADWGPFFDGNGSYVKTDEFKVSCRTTGEKDPTVLALGVGTQIYGRRADIIKFDDVADVESSRNPARVEQLRQWIDREALSRIGRRSKAVFIGTRVNPGDIYSALLPRQGYKWVKYSCIIDESSERVLWPDHFPFDAAIVKRSEMSPGDWQLIYQNVDAFGSGNSFTEDMISTAKDSSAAIGVYESKWRLFAGLDPAGAGGKNSGVTAFTLLAVDLQTGERRVIDHHAQKSMPSYQAKELILDWSQRYPVYEWIVEGNSLQQQLFAQDRSLTQELAKLGTRVRSHQTTGKKWDPQSGVESLGPLMGTGLFKIPWGNGPSIRAMQPLIDEFAVFPLGTTSDRVMSVWFADIGARDHLRRGQLPMFNERATRNWPSHVKKRRRVFDLQSQTVRRPVRSDSPPFGLDPAPRRFVNVPGGPDDANRTLDPKAR